MKKLFVLTMSVGVAALLTACSETGKSDAVAEVQPFDRLCSYEKWKNVAFEGYISPKSVDCKGTKSKRSSTATINECTIKVFSNPQETGKSVSVTVDAQEGSLKFNEIVPPPTVFKAEDLKIYDNEEKLIPLGSKVRIIGTLRNVDECHLDSVRLDVAN